MGLILLLGFLSFLVFRPLLDAIVLGFVFAFALYPVYRRVLKVVRKPGVAAGIMIVVVAILLVGPLLLITAFLLNDIRNFAASFDPVRLQEDVVGGIQTFLVSVGYVPSEGVMDVIRDRLAQAGDQLQSVLTGLATQALTRLPAAILAVFVFLFSLFYGFADGHRFVAAVRNALPLHPSEKDLLIHEFKRTTAAVFTGHILISIIQGAIGTIGFFIFGVDNALFWGFVMAVAGILPVIGPFVIWAPISLYMIATGDVFRGIGVLLWGALLVSTIDNVLRPKLIGSRADIHPFIVLVGVLGGIAVFGFTGFILGPLVLSMFIVSVRVYLHHWKEGPEDEAWREKPPNGGAAAPALDEKSDSGTAPAGA